MTASSFTDERSEPSRSHSTHTRTHRHPRHYYSTINRDPTHRISSNVIKILKRLEKNNELTRRERLDLTISDPICPQMYGLPKIHKEGIPLRPIVCFIGSPTYDISAMLSRILQPLVEHSSRRIKNSAQLCDILRAVHLEESERLVSYDVINLFGSVPTTEAVQLAITRLRSDASLSTRTKLSIESIGELLKLCMGETYFKCFSTCFKSSTCPMGSPLSPVMCEIVMQELEEKVLRRFPTGVRVFLRYVDDCFSIVESNTEERLFNELNSVHPDIKFTKEMETNGRISMLDVAIERRGTKMVTSVFRKATNTNLLLNFESSHPPHVKTGIVKCFVARARKVCDPDRLHEEMSFLQRIFTENGYPRNVVCNMNGAINKERRAVNRERTVFLPYCKGISERISRVCKKYNYETIFKPCSSLKNCLTKVKQQEEQCGAVYRVNCKDCRQFYIGETSRKILTREKEHRRDIKNIDYKSAVAQHTHEMGHEPSFPAEQVTIERNWMRRRIKEAIYISNNQDRVYNRDRGLEFSAIWNSVLFKHSRQFNL